MQDRIHLFCDRHLDSAGASQSDSGLRGEYSFSDCPVHARDDFRKFAPATQFDTHAAVARKSSRTGEHQVSQTGKSSHGFLPASTNHCQACDLSQAASDESGDRIVTES